MGVDVVLDQHRDAVERSAPSAVGGLGVARLGLAEGASGCSVHTALVWTSTDSIAVEQPLDLVAGGSQREEGTTRSCPTRPRDVGSSGRSHGAARPRSPYAPGMSETGHTESGLPFEPLYGPDALDGFDPATQLGEPGEYPFTRGVYPSMYTGRPWTMRQYAGFGTAKESNARYQQLVANGTGGLSVAFDLPTQMGHDSDAADRARRGRQGGRRDRLHRRHASALRRPPARQGLHVDDDQRPGGAAAADVPARRRGERRPAATRSPARSRTTCSRSTSPAAPTSTRRRTPCG